MGEKGDLMIHRGVAAAALTVATCGLVFGTASAHKKGFKTEAFIEAHSTGDALVLMGDTFSPKEKCVRKRLVSIFRKRPGDDKLMGKGRTDGTGVFEIAVAERSGTYYAKVRRKNIGSGSHKHICKGARSPNYQVSIWR
jgi:hypothetical protein